MTAATKTLLSQLAQHIGGNFAKRRELIVYCEESTGRRLYRAMVLKYLRGTGQPTADFLLPILCWMHAEGVIRPTATPGGLFTYARALKPASKSVAAASQPVAKRPKPGYKKGK